MWDSLGPCHVWNSRAEGGGLCHRQSGMTETTERAISRIEAVAAELEAAATQLQTVDAPPGLVALATEALQADACQRREAAARLAASEDHDVDRERELEAQIAELQRELGQLRTSREQAAADRRRLAAQSSALPAHRHAVALPLPARDPLGELLERGRERAAARVADATRTALQRAGHRSGALLAAWLLDDAATLERATAELERHNGAQQRREPRPDRRRSVSVADLQHVLGASYQAAAQSCAV